MFFYKARYSSRGVLLASELHDRNIVGVMVDSAKTLRLFIEDSPMHALRVPSLSRMSVNNFREGNVLLDVQLVLGAEEKLVIFNKLYGDGMREDVLRGYLAKLEDGESVLMKVTTSYGCDAVIHANCRPDAVQYLPVGKGTDGFLAK